MWTATSSQKIACRLPEPQFLSRCDPDRLEACGSGALRSPPEVTLPTQTKTGKVSAAAAARLFLIVMEADGPVPHSYSAQLLQGAANIAMIEA